MTAGDRKSLRRMLEFGWAGGLSLLMAVNAASAAVEISASPTRNMSCSAGVCTATAKQAVLNGTDLANMLATGDTKIVSGATAKDIDVDVALNWVSASRLTFDGYRSVAFKQPVEVSGPGALTIVTNDGGLNGDYSFLDKGHVEFWSDTGSLVINGHSYVLVYNLRQIQHATEVQDCYIALAKAIRSGRKLYTASPVESLDATLEGLGNTISGLTINDQTNNDNVGLIGVLGGTACPNGVRDLGLKSSNITGSGSGQTLGTLIGKNEGGFVQKSHSSGQISASGDAVVGGLVGDSGGGLISLSYSTATISISGTGSNGAVGGLVGINAGTCITGCRGTISQSFSAGAISAGANTMAGGLAGYNSGASISNSFALGAVSGGDASLVGGLIGVNADSPSENAQASVSSSYSTGLVSGTAGSVLGGLIGQDNAASGIADAYWNLDTSGIPDPSQGAGNVANDPGITGVTTVQLQSGLPTGFDASIWLTKASGNSGFPYLRTLPPG